MKILVLIALITASCAHAFCSTENYGTLSVTRCDDGTYLTSERTNDLTFHDFHDGRYATTHHYPGGSFTTVEDYRLRTPVLKLPVHPYLR